MAVTYTWEITQLHVSDLPNNPNTVASISWRKIGTNEDGVIGIYEGGTKFDLDAVAITLGTNSNTKFVDFSDLKEKTILSWIKKNIDKRYEDYINNSIDQKINENKYNKKIVDFPWKKNKD